MVACLKYRHVPQAFRHTAPAHSTAERADPLFGLNLACDEPPPEFLRLRQEPTTTCGVPKARTAPGSCASISARFAASGSTMIRPRHVPASASLFCFSQSPRTLRSSWLSCLSEAGKRSTNRSARATSHPSRRTRRRHSRPGPLRNGTVPRGNRKDRGWGWRSWLVSCDFGLVSYSLSSKHPMFMGGKRQSQQAPRGFHRA